MDLAQHIQMGVGLGLNRGETMSEDSQDNDPPQSAYYIGFGISIVLLAVTMFQYPLW